MIKILLYLNGYTSEVLKTYMRNFSYAMHNSDLEDRTVMKDRRRLWPATNKRKQVLMYYRAGKGVRNICKSRFIHVQRASDAAFQHPIARTRNTLLAHAAVMRRSAARHA